MPKKADGICQLFLNSLKFKIATRVKIQQLFIFVLMSTSFHTNSSSYYEYFPCYGFIMYMGMIAKHFQQEQKITDNVFHLWRGLSPKEPLAPQTKAATNSACTRQKCECLMSSSGPLLIHLCKSYHMLPHCPLSQLVPGSCHLQSFTLESFFPSL